MFILPGFFPDVKEKAYNHIGNLTELNYLRLKWNESVTDTNVVTMLRGLNKLIILDLSADAPKKYNKYCLTDYAITHGVVPFCPGLLILNVSYQNYIGDVGLSALQNSPLQRLGACGTRLTDKGTRALLYTAGSRICYLDATECDGVGRTTYKTAESALCHFRHVNSTPGKGYYERLSRRLERNGPALLLPGGVNYIALLELHIGCQKSGSIMSPGAEFWSTPIHPVEGLFVSQFGGSEPGQYVALTKTAIQERGVRQIYTQVEFVESPQYPESRRTFVGVWKSLYTHQ